MRLSGWLLSIAALGAALGAGADNAAAQSYRVGLQPESAESPSDAPPLPPNGNGGLAGPAPSTRNGVAPTPLHGPAYAPAYQPGSTRYSPPTGPQPWETPVHDPAWNGHPCWNDWGSTSFLSI